MRATRTIHAPIAAKLHTATCEYSDESGIPMARIVEDALRLYLIRKCGDDYGPGRLDNLYRRIEGEL